MPDGQGGYLSEAQKANASFLFGICVLLLPWAWQLLECNRRHPLFLFSVFFPKLFGFNTDSKICYVKCDFSVLGWTQLGLSLHPAISCCLRGGICVILYHWIHQHSVHSPEQWFPSPCPCFCQFFCCCDIQCFKTPSLFPVHSMVLS